MFSSTGNIRKAVGEYILDEPLFMDSFSSTYQAFHIHTSQEALVRIVETSTLSMINNSYQIMQDEIKLLQQFVHPNIIKLINLFSTKNNCYLIYEACSGGNLETYNNINRFIPENEAVKLLHEILHGYGEFYQRNIILKSIRLDSFILHEKSIKFFDISLVKNFEKFKKETFLKTNIKFWFSLAPEIYFGAPQNNKCDIWSLGIIFYQMLFGELPWRSDNIEGFFKAASTQTPNLANKYQKISKPTLNALLKMLQPDPSKRVNYEELIKDPLFTNYYDRLHEREQKVIQKIRHNPECWQAASMMYTADPLISIFDLAESIKSSTSKKSSLKKSKPENFSGELSGNIGLVGSQGQIGNFQQIGGHIMSQQNEQEKLQQNNNNGNKPHGMLSQSVNLNNGMEDNGLSAFEKLKSEIKNLNIPTPITTQPQGLNQSQGRVPNNQFVQAPLMNQSMPVMAKDYAAVQNNPKTFPFVNQTQGQGMNIEKQTISTLNPNLIGGQNQTLSGSVMNVNTQQPISNKISIQNKLQTKSVMPLQRQQTQTFSAELLPEFRKYTARINFLCDFCQLYSQSASSAAKLLKTEFIIFECFFLYKKLLKSLRIFYDALAGGENIFSFPRWEEYMNSPHFFHAVETVETHLESVEDIFDKLYTECKKKLSDPRLQIDRFRNYITDDLEDIDTHLNSFLIPYLEKFLPSEENIGDKDRTLLIIKHKVEIVNVLLLNKMSEANPEDVIVSLKEHKAILKNGDINAVREYFNQQYKKLDLFKLNNLKNII